MKYHFAYLALILLLSADTFAQRWSVSNNLLYDAALTPNLGVAYDIDSLWTTGVNVGYNPFPTDDTKDTKWRHIMIAPNVRHWCDSLEHRSFWGATIIYSHFNVSNVDGWPLFGLYKAVKDNRRQGDLIAAGVSYGRAWRLSRYFCIEAELGIDIGYAWGREYACGHCGTDLGKFNGLFLMPKLGLNLCLRKEKDKLENNERRLK